VLNSNQASFSSKLAARPDSASVSKLGSGSPIVGQKRLGFNAASPSPKKSNRNLFRSFGQATKIIDDGSDSEVEVAPMAKVNLGAISSASIKEFGLTQSDIK